MFAFCSFHVQSVSFWSPSWTKELISVWSVDWLAICCPSNKYALIVDWHDFQKSYVRCKCTQSIWWVVQRRNSRNYASDILNVFLQNILKCLVTVSNEMVRQSMLPEFLSVRHKQVSQIVCAKVGLLRCLLVQKWHHTWDTPVHQEPLETKPLPNYLL